MQKLLFDAAIVKGLRIVPVHACWIDLANRQDGVIANEMCCAVFGSWVILSIDTVLYRTGSVLR